jgi:shikimate dehydrogenase
MEKYGIIGKTLVHSFSKKYFENKFENENISDTEFNEYELENIEEITKLVSNNPELKGFSVTIPYKEAIIPFLDEADDAVKEIGACNCVKVENGKLIGYNTDTLGFLESFLTMYEIHYFKAVILGNGGASKAVVNALEELSIDSLIVARNPKNKEEINWNDLNESHFEDVNIVVNTTPLGTFPNIDEFPNIPYSIFNEHFLAFDLIYNPEKTIFLKNAEENRAKIINGYDMLQFQADRAWEIWRK